MPAHTSLLVWQILTSTKTTMVFHPPYSPDQALCDFFLFPKMKLKLKGRRFESIQAESQDVMKMQTQNDFQQCFRSWKCHRDRYINAEGDYFEGNGGE
jgi:transposase